jgi:hypothetical protein
MHANALCGIMPQRAQKIFPSTPLAAEAAALNDTSDLQVVPALVFLAGKAPARQAARWWHFKAQQQNRSSSSSRRSSSSGDNIATAVTSGLLLLRQGINLQYQGPS